VVRKDDLTIAVTMASCLLSPALAQEPLSRTIGSWEIIATTDNMTDEKSVGAVNANRAIDGRDDPTALMISCPYSQSLSVSLRTDGYWPTNEYHMGVTYRVDGKPAVRELWLTSPINPHRVQFNNPRALLAALRQGSRVRFRISPLYGEHEGAFDLAGTGEMIAAMEKLCAATWSSGRKEPGQKAQVPKRIPGSPLSLEAR
jgi:hypothetical protein